MNPKDEKAAEKSALNLIKYRARSEKELSVRLKEKGFDDEVIGKVVEKCKKNGLIDDKLFAYLYAYDKLTLDKKGPLFIQHELKRLGVEESLIFESLDKVKNEVDINTIALELAKNYYERKQDILKTKVYLYRRGFEPDIINCVIENLRGD
ncbi:RecX family transcriptional regulator [Petrotoga sibirica DSM 13575]|uniref:Regulatory protein RecX n=1 Tax=Petrotoga sibirica DSM 13575 TaxID=1122956 RepID=A0A855MVA6_9BACT|nr:RecX family transcriptional regulator [Petrotoga sibirica DSM 13575]POZ91943.1 RecX family transcriptional regulator [Petrotoga sp. SL27]